MVSPVRPGDGGAAPVRAPLISDLVKERVAKIALIAFISLAAFAILPAEAAIGITAVAILIGVISLTDCVIIPVERRPFPFFGFWPSFFRLPSPAPVHTTLRAYGPYPTAPRASFSPSAVVHGVPVAQPGPRVVVGSGLPGARAVYPPEPAAAPRPPGGPAPFGTRRVPVGGGHQ